MVVISHGFRSEIRGQSWLEDNGRPSDDPEATVDADPVTIGMLNMFHLMMDGSMIDND